MLITIAQLKARLGKSAAITSDDDLITEIVTNVSVQIANECGRRTRAGRPCLERGSLVEVHNVIDMTAHLRVAAWPVVSITSIIEAMYADFTGSGAYTLIAGDDYHADNDQGALHRVGCWLRGSQTVQVTYVGGYNTAADWATGTEYTTGDSVAYLGAIYECAADVSGSTAPAADADHWELSGTEVALPDDLREACLIQCVHNWNRKDNPGSSGESLQGGSVNFTGAYGLLDVVKHTCRAYRRLM